MLIEIGHIYRAKKPKRYGFYSYYDDRKVIFASETSVQYDSVTVRWGSRFPTVDRAKFEAWAGSDVTDGYPEDDWARWP